MVLTPSWSPAMRPATDATLMMRPEPRASIWRPTACVMRNMPSRLTAITWRQRSKGMSSVASPHVCPALLTRISTCPNASSAAFSAWLTSSCRVTSATTFAQVMPWRVSSSIVGARYSSRLPVMTTCAPALPSASAATLPMPLPPPVISATEPERSKSCCACMPVSFEISAPDLTQRGHASSGRQQCLRATCHRLPMPRQACLDLHRGELAHTLARERHIMAEHVWWWQDAPLARANGVTREEQLARRRVERNMPHGMPWRLDHTQAPLSAQRGQCLTFAHGMGDGAGAQTWKERHAKDQRQWPVWNLARRSPFNRLRVGRVRPGLGARRFYERRQAADMINMLMCQQDAPHITRRMTQRCERRQDTLLSPWHAYVNDGETVWLADDIDITGDIIYLMDIRKDTHSSLPETHDRF